MALFKPEKRAPTGRSGQWDVVLGEDMCKACGFCLHICPTDVFAWRTTTNQLGWFPMYVAHEENCIGCMLCYQICPDFCINVERKPAYAAAEGEGAALSCGPSADTVAGNGAALSCGPSAHAVAGNGGTLSCAPSADAVAGDDL